MLHARKMGVSLTKEERTQTGRAGPAPRPDRGSAPRSAGNRHTAEGAGSPGTQPAGSAGTYSTTSGRSKTQFLDAPVPFWLSRDAKEAVDMCPALALSLTRVKEEPRPSALPGPVRGHVPDLTSRSAGMPGLTKRAKRDADLAMTTAWIAALGDGRPD
jgi:hypothetical protein